MARPYLSNEYIRLRAIDLNDTELLYKWEHDTLSWDSSLTLNPISSQFIKDYIADSPHSIVRKGELFLIIEEITQNAPIGYAQLLNYDCISRKAGLGLYIAPEYRRLGYAHNVIRLLEDYAFRRLGVNMLYADILSSNQACCLLFEKLGYTHTATLPKWHWSNGQYHDLRYYQLWNTQESS